MPPVFLNVDRKVTFRFSAAERNIWRKKPKIPVSQWAELHRIVTRGPLEGSRYKRDTVPYLNGIMDASFFPSVRTVIVCSGPQVGKSFFVDTCIGYAIDRDPGPVLYVYPDEDTATENAKDRIIPMIIKSSNLKSYLTGSGDDEGAKRIGLQHMQIYMAWARSAIKLGNKSIKYVVFDETDKYPDTANKREADPISLGEARVTTYRWGYKIWKISTPTVESGPIWRAMTTEAQVVFDYWVRCPKCKTFQVMEFKQIKWPPEERDAEKVEAENLAHYECVHCKARWNDHMRDRAVRLGQWRSRNRTQIHTDDTDKKKEFEFLKIPKICENLRPMKLAAYLKLHRPHKIGFHIPSWLSRFIPISRVAAAFLKYRQTKSFEDLKNFKNRYEAEPWRIEYAERKEDGILALRDGRPAGLVPGGGVVYAVVAGVDVQATGCYFRVRAFGYGPEKESWGIRFGFVDSFEALHDIIIDNRYLDPDGGEHAIMLSLIDSGFRTNEVYAFTRRRFPRVLAAKGQDSTTMTQIIATGNIEVFPGTNKPIPGGLKLIRHKANYWKDGLALKLNVKSQDPGAFHIEEDPSIEEYARQMCAEAPVRPGEWENPRQRANHYWDCEVLCFVAAELLKTQDRKKLQERRAESKEQIEKTGRSAWLGNRSEWLKR